MLLPATEPGSFLGKRVATADGLVDLAPADLVADLDRLSRAEADLSRPGVLRLIGRRDRRTHNCWMHNNSHIRQPDGNTALLHPDDAAARGHRRRRAGRGQQRHRVGRGRGVPHRPTSPAASSWCRTGGATRRPGRERARALAGANINTVIPGGATHMDPVSGQAVMLAHEVEVRPPTARGPGLRPLSGCGARCWR